MITGIMVIIIVWFVLAGVATLHFYVVRTIAYWRYEKNQQLDNCKECLCRMLAESMMAENNDIANMSNKDREN